MYMYSVRFIASCLICVQKRHLILYFVFFYEKLPRHKALKCHSKCRLELKKGGGGIKKPNKILSKILICCHLTLFHQYFEVSHPTERLLHFKMNIHIALECLEAIHWRKVCIRVRVPH